MKKSRIEFNLVRVSDDVWEVYFEGKKLMIGTAASCKNLLEAFAEISLLSTGGYMGELLPIVKGGAK